MSNEITFIDSPGKTCYILLWNSIGQVYNTNTLAFASYNSSNYALYKLVAVEQGVATGIYFASMPAVGVGHYNIIAYEQAGGSPNESDLKVGLGEIYWNGSSTVVFNTDTTGKIAIQSGISRSVALNNFEFPMVSSTDHETLQTGLTVTAQRSVDGTAFVNCVNTPSEIGNGVYTINLAAADLGGSVITLKFTATGADPTLITITTTP